MPIAPSSSRSSAHGIERALLAFALREQLACEGALEIEAQGSSMEPTVPGGSVLRVEPLFGLPAPGELIAFVPQRGALLCCHRVVARDGASHVVTQGDRHGAPDASSPLERIVGVVRSFTLGGRAYAVGPELPRPRPSLYRRQRQRLVRLVRRVRAA
jgi:hypothetical protein